MKNVALTNCLCGFADGWDEVLKRKDDLALIKVVAIAVIRVNSLMVVIKGSMIV